MSNYKIGDRVRLITEIKGAEKVPIGTCGTVVEVDGPFVDVLWDGFGKWLAASIKVKPATLASTDFDINSDPKTWTTRDGRKVTIYCTNAPGKECIHGRLDDDGKLLSWPSSGKFWGAGRGFHPFDLISPRKTVKVDFWVNVYPDGTCGAQAFDWTTKERADKAADKDRIACKHIVMEISEGEFDQ